MDCYGRALRLAPDYAVAHMNRSLAWLQMGDFARGWAEYEWRWNCPEHPVPNLEEPLWDGSPLDGRTILLRAEQGLGDTLQFIRYASLVERRGGRVVVSCPGSLARLAAGARRRPRRAGGAAGLRVCLSRPADEPAPDPRHNAPDHPRHGPLPLARSRAVRPLARGARTDRRPPVGIAWQGNPDHKKDRLRSFSLDRFEPLARIPGVRLFSLQKGFGSEQWKGRGKRLPIIDLGPRLDDFMDAAAAAACLDLLILPDTALAHLAGRLGVPVWVAVPWAADWRWLLEREDTPWYPTMRLFRQTRWDDWDAVFLRIGRELAALAETRQRLSPACRRG